MTNQLALLAQSLFSHDEVVQRRQYDEEDKETIETRNYMELTLAANVPSFPLSDPMLQAQNYVDLVYLNIQHLMLSMSGANIGLEKKTGRKRNKGVAQGGAQYTDQGYEPYEDHPLWDILNNPNPQDTFTEFLCQTILNWNLHGRLLIWKRLNRAKAPIRYYCMPVPLMTPAFPVGSERYPFGAWQFQQYYPGTGIAGIIPTGLTGQVGMIIDSREIIEMRNPHPIFRWAPYSHLTGGDTAIDISRNIDLSFWSIMAQGPKPAGFIDAPGADKPQIKQMEDKIDSAAGGARKHGRPIVLGGGDPDRPAIKWNPLGALVPDALHAEGWEIFAGFICALFGNDLINIGIRPGGGTHAEKWAARKEKREMLKVYLSKLASKMTQGMCRPWGLFNKGVRVIINMPEDVGYDPAEMSRDGAGDGSMSYNEVRHLRGMKDVDGPMEEFGDMPVSVALKMLEKKLGVDETTQQKELAEQQAKLAPPPNSTNETRNNPDNNRPSTPKDAKGSLGGEGAGAPKTQIKSVVPCEPENMTESDSPTMTTDGRHIVNTGQKATAFPQTDRFSVAQHLEQDARALIPPQETLEGMVERVLSAPILLNGSANGKPH